MGKACNIITVKHALSEYPVVIGRGALARLGDIVNLKRRCFVVTDDGVPCEYAKAVLSQCESGEIMTLPQGEATKSLSSLEEILKALLSGGYDRGSLIIAVGGGVIGDLSGFAAACFMRGIDFLNIPTTTLSQIDSSIGGKTGIDFFGVKNSVGAFHHPIAVIIDSDTLKTLPKRHYNNGLVEAVKAGLIMDKVLFSLFENQEEFDIDKIIYLALNVKKTVVEKDEGEVGIRRSLNLGHTLGHGIEAAADMRLLHGEAVAIGIIPMLDTDDLKKRVLAVFKRLEMPLDEKYDRGKAVFAMGKDKKSDKEDIITVRVGEVGSCYFSKIKKEKLAELL